MMRSLALWLSGYPASLADDVGLSVADRGRMTLVGGGVGLSALMALASGALASTWVTAGQPFELRLAIAAAAGAALAFGVVLLDRSTIIAGDHRPAGGRRPWIGLVRLAMILAVSTSTWLKVAPTFIGPALVAEATDEQERRDNQRSSDLAARFNLQALSKDQKAATQRVNSLRREIEVVPGDIAHALAEATQCFARVAVERQRLINGGFSPREAAASTGAERAACSIERRQADQQLTARRVTLRAELNDEQRDATVLRRQRDNATAAVTERITDGRASDRQFITQANLEVLSKLVLRDPLVLAEMFGGWLLLALFDGAGLIAKAALGRTEAGERIGVDRSIGKLEASARLRSAEFDADESNALRGALGAAMISALESAETRQSLEQASARLATLIAPLAAAAIAAKEMEEHAATIERTIRRSPRLAAMIAEVFGDALAMASRNFAGARP